MYLGPNGLKISEIAGDFAAHSAVPARIGLSGLDCGVETPLTRHQLSPIPRFPGGRGLGAAMRLTFLTRPYSAQDWNDRQPARTYRERGKYAAPWEPNTVSGARDGTTLRTPLTAEERAL
jgi:hypothetical protein